MVTRWIDGHEIPEGQGRCYEVDGEHVAVVNIEGTFFGMHGGCPCARQAVEKGAPLSQVIENCPQHDWTYDPAHGACCFEPASVAELRTAQSQARFWEKDAPDTEVEL